MPVPWALSTCCGKTTSSKTSLAVCTSLKTGLPWAALWLWLPVVSTYGTCLPWVEIFGDDSVLQFGGGTLGHPWGNAPGATANRVALEACVQARNEGRDLAREGGDIIREAAKWSPELAAACELWKEIKFEFDTVDTI